MEINLRSEHEPIRLRDLFSNLDAWDLKVTHCTRSRAGWKRRCYRLCLGLLMVSGGMRGVVALQADSEDDPIKVSQRQPQVNGIYPMGVQPGSRVTINIHGEFLDRVSSVQLESPDVSGSILNGTFTAARAELRIAADAEPGPRFFRVISPRGVSNLVMFRVTRWPTPLEAEPNDELDSAMPVHPPVLLNGRLDSLQDVDLYRFHASRGQRLQFNVLGARNWSSADVSLTILTAAGRQIATEEGQFIWDPYLDHVFDQEGDYLAAITVTRMPAGGQSRNDLNYQLAIGQSPFLWSLFPAGGRRGQHQEVSLRADFVSPTTRPRFRSHGISGRLLDSELPGFLTLAATIEKTASSGPHLFLVSDESGTLNPLTYLAGDLPEILDAEPNNGPHSAQLVDVPVTVNGRLDRSGDEDWFHVSGKAGMKLALEVDAEKIGSVLDSNLTVFGPDGKQVVENDDAAIPGRRLNRDSRIEYALSEDGTYTVRLASRFRLGGPDHVYRLTIRPQAPYFFLSIDSDRAFVPVGATGELRFSVIRREGFEDPVVVEAGSLPEGVTTEPVTVPGTESRGVLVFKASSTASLTAVPIQITAGTLGDKAVRAREIVLPGSRYQGSGPAFLDYRPPAVVVGVVEPVRFSLESAASTVYLVRGGTAEFGIKIARALDFQEQLDFDLENLPPGVTLDSVESIDEGRMVRLTLRAANTAARTRVSNLTVLAHANAAGGREIIEAAPQITLQVD
ncbi:MAG: PPC domain-containing protein [Acidobacteriota bacterium]